MNNFFISVLDMSLIASFVALVVMLIRLLLKKTPKIFSYVLWAVVLFRFICPFKFESQVSLIPENSASLNNLTNGINILDNTLTESSHSNLSVLNNSTGVNTLQPIITIAAIIWTFGILILLSYGVISYLRLRKRLSVSTFVKENIYETDRIQTPFVLGIIKPKIFIPTGLSNVELDYVLKHEKTHIKRFDYIIKLFAYLACVLHWFNPISWTSYFLMIKDMEMSCDESVMRKSEDDVRIKYANSLFSFSVRQNGLFIPLAFGESSVKSRIKNVLHYRKPALWIIVVAVVIVALVSVGLSLNNAPEKSFSAPKKSFGKAEAIAMILQEKPGFPRNTEEVKTAILGYGGGPGPGYLVKAELKTVVEEIKGDYFIITLTKDWNINHLKSYWKYKVEPDKITLLESVNNDGDARVIMNTMK